MENSEWNLFSDDLEESPISSRFNDYEFDDIEDEKLPSQELLIPSSFDALKEEKYNNVDMHSQVQEEVLILITVLDNFIPPNFHDHYTLLQILTDRLGTFNERGCFREQWKNNGQIYKDISYHPEYYK